jgi:hypothetical protein
MIYLIFLIIFTSSIFLKSSLGNNLLPKYMVEAYYSGDRIRCNAVLSW